jgi:hypothetical protein
MPLEHTATNANSFKAKCKQFKQKQKKVRRFKTIQKLIVSSPSMCQMVVKGCEP